MIKSKKLSSVLLATAILLGVTTGASANTTTTTPTSLPQSALTTGTTLEVVDVKTTVDNGKVITVIKYKDGTESTVTTALPSVTGNGTTTTTPQKTIDPQYLPPEDYSSKIFGTANEADLRSNDDGTRRTTLQSMFGLTFTDEDEVYDNNEGIPHDNHLGQQTYNTPVKDLKSMGIYAVNANRQELIMYAIRTGDWQPYRKSEYKRTPLYFSLTEDNKLEYSKIYWSWHISGEISSHRDDMMAFHQGDLSLRKTKEELEAEHKRVMNDYIAKWKAAKGPIVYVDGFNSREDYAKEWGVEVVPSDYFNSVYNDPSVIRDGKFSEGAKTKTWY